MNTNILSPQNLTLQTLLTILNTTKSTEIPNILKSLDQDAQDTLMKYLYKGMALPGWGDVSGSVLLGWHEKVRSCLFGFFLGVNMLNLC
jgi:actin related protein 2/3 complex subunit 5